MRIQQRLALGLIAAGLAGFTQAAMTIPMHAVDAEGVGDRVGQITVTETDHGLVFSPEMKGLESGAHGFHVHQNASCEPAGKEGSMTAAAAAGGHYDPEETGHHGTPWGDGHLGDLPALYVNGDGNATMPVLAPRLEMDDLEGRAVMIHAGGDNYSDQPKPLGGGGARMACGVVPE